MAAATVPLSSAQIRLFRDDGALVLRSFIGAETVASWLEQWEAKTGAICDKPSTWPGKTPDPEWRTEPKLTELPQVKALAEQLSGEGGLKTCAQSLAVHCHPSCGPATVAKRAFCSRREQMTRLLLRHTSTQVLSF